MLASPRFLLATILALAATVVAFVTGHSHDVPDVVVIWWLMTLAVCFLAHNYAVAATAARKD